MLNKTKISVAIAAATLFSAQLSTAQDVASENVMLEEVVSLGTRVDGRSAADSVAPIDVLSAEELTSRGDGDMANILRDAIPSFNVNDQPISDAMTAVRPANIRGLAPDQTLVMVNGKRRHRAAVIAFQSPGLSNGSQGADLSAIPASALKQVEVLRDGASAQYGSDAIAGVLNFALKDASEGGSIDVKLGSTYEGDGDFYVVSINKGFKLTEKGFANVTFEYGDKDATSRSVQRADAAALNETGNYQIQDPAQIWGQPDTSDDIKLFINTGLELADNRELYAFGNYGSRSVLGGFYFRNPENRGSVYTSAPGVPLVGDLTGDMSGECDYATAMADGLDGNCFVVNEMYPNGFTPNFGVDLTDMSGVVGLRGELAGDISYDISYGVGQNEASFNIVNTINASLGPISPKDFNPGTYVQTEQNFNIDLSKGWSVTGADINLAGGFEWREENFETKIGDIASWEAGPLTEQGFGIGSNGFPGFGPQVAGEWDRSNIAFYTDLEAVIAEDFTVGAAVRWEDFDSFGSTTNWKLSARYDITENFALRGTASTGFRAPTPGQANVVNVTTSNTTDPVTGVPALIDIGTISASTASLINDDAKELGPEESTNYSFGLVWSPIEGLDVTVDAYQIEVEGRVALTGNFKVTEDDRQVLIDNGVPGANGLSEYRFFANDYTTKTKGVDVVATYDVLDGVGFLSAVYNHNETEVTEESLLTEAALFDIEKALPEDRLNLSYTHNVSDKIYVLGRANWYGDSVYQHAQDNTLLIDQNSTWTFDLEAGYDVTESFSLVGGVSNLSDENYDNPYADILGAKYSEGSPFGFQGGMYYMRARYSF